VTALDKRRGSRQKGGMRRALPVFGRRQVLVWSAAVGASSALGCQSSSSSGPAPSTTFFTDPERRALGALCDIVVPSDSLGPGATELGAVQFIEGLLTAFDGTGTPTIFAGGPYSGRTPFADGSGNPSSNYPGNDFATWLPLSRTAEAAWRLRLFGSNGVPGGGPNDAVLGPTVGLRDQVKQLLAAAMGASSAPLETLDPATLATVFQNLESDAQNLLISLVSQATFAPPEYGGNQGLQGWQLANFEGDSQPLGYSWYDQLAGTYHERPDAPVSTPNPTPDPAPLTDDTRTLLLSILGFIGGQEFTP
jgi:gluconate 2-dehydrogenase subunit 3-like protein